jgi:hypothetical protein
MTTITEMIRINVSHLLPEADRRARAMYKIDHDMSEEDFISVATSSQVNSHSMRGYSGAQVGKLGELVVYEHLARCGVNFTERDLLTHDATYIDELGSERKLEIKTKERHVAPREDYECSTSEYNKGFQAPDYYFFVSLFSTQKKSMDINRFTEAYILGSMSGVEFEQEARLLGTDYVDNSNGFSPTSAARNVFISQLTPPKIVVC